MSRCPHCNNKISFWKPWLLTSFNGIKCPTCGKRLFANKKINSLIGGIGGGTGALVGTNLYKYNFGLISVIIAIVWFMSLLVVSSLFTKFEVKDK